MLDRTREKVDPFLNIVAKRFSRINPETLSWFALIFAISSGILFYFSRPDFELQNYFLLFAALFVFLNGLFDAIDGQVARLSNKTSARANFIDHTLDRYDDVFIVGGLALSAWCRPSIGLLAIIGVLLTSYMGTQAQAIGYKRDYSGLLGRADRLAFLMIVPLVQHFTLYYTFQLPGNTTVLEWVLIYFAIAGNITAIQRFYNTLKWFKKK
jgi:archaetidylinositol phosphate synthase